MSRRGALGLCLGLGVAWLARGAWPVPARTVPAADPSVAGPSTAAGGLGPRDDGTTVKVGLLVVTGGEEAPLGLAARRGAELAVREANGRGGADGRPVRLVVRSMEGPWGSGTGQVVDLVFEEGVIAVLGSLDGRSAHVAEQVVTKGLVVFMATRATDPTLTQIKVPWVFRVVPDDRRQAAALVEEIVGRRGLRRVATVAAETYDARVAAAALRAAAARAGASGVLGLRYGGERAEARDIADRLRREQVEAVVLFGPPKAMAELVRELRARGAPQALFVPLSLADEAFFAAARPYLEGAVVVAPGHWSAPDGAAFQAAYREAYGTPPAAAAAYAYDGMRLLIAAIREAGPERAGVRDALAAIRYRHGATGAIRFDSAGEWEGPVSLAEIRRGRPVLLSR